MLSNKLVTVFVIGGALALTGFISPARGGVSLTVAGPGAGTGDTIYCERPVIFNIRFTNNTGDTILSSSNGFRLYSPDGAVWSPPVFDTAGGLDAYYDGNVFSGGMSVDGVSDDTIWVGGSSPPPAIGIPPGYDDVVLEIGTWLDCSQVGKTLCIDSTWFPPAGVWLWQTTAGSISPTWDGPHCFVIEPHPQPDLHNRGIHKVSFLPGANRPSYRVRVDWYAAVESATTPQDTIPFGCLIEVSVNETVVEQLVQPVVYKPYEIPVTCPDVHNFDPLGCIDACVYNKCGWFVMGADTFNIPTCECMALWEGLRPWGDPPFWSCPCFGAMSAISQEYTLDSGDVIRAVIVPFTGTFQEVHTLDDTLETVFEPTPEPYRNRAIDDVSLVPGSEPGSWRVKVCWSAEADATEEEVDLGHQIIVEIDDIVVEQVFNPVVYRPNASIPCPPVVSDCASECTDFFQCGDFIRLFDTAQGDCGCRQVGPDLGLCDCIFSMCFETINEFRFAIDTGSVVKAKIVPLTWAWWETYTDDDSLQIVCCPCCNSDGIRGDADNDCTFGCVNVADLSYLVAYLFQSGPVPVCEEEADADSDCTFGCVNVADLSFLVAFLFQSGPAPGPCP